MNLSWTIFPKLTTAWALNVGGALITVIIAVLGWLAVTVLHGHADALAASRDGRMLLMSKAERLHQRHQDLTKQVALAQATVQTLRARVPDSPEEAAFLQQLSDLASAAGVELSDFRPGGQTDRKQFKEMGIQVRGAGPYQAVCEFLAGVEQLPRLFRLGQLTISAPAQRDGNCAVDLQLYVAFALNAAALPVTKGVQP